MTTPQQYHCVIQLQDDSWEYRLKQPEDPFNDDDLVSWTDYLAMHDRLIEERNAIDTQRVKELEQLRTLLSEAWRQRDELKIRILELSKVMEDVIPDLFPDQQPKVRHALLLMKGGKV